MFRVAQQWGCGQSLGNRPAIVALWVGAVVAGLAGCSSQPQWRETGYSDQGKTQIQFYAPPGANVTVVNPVRSHQVAAYGPFGNRLEQTPEEYSVFNLAPGRYEFKYTAAEGVPDVSIYGELDVKHVNNEYAQVFQRRAFVPIALPSEHYRRVEVVGNETFPYRGEAFRTAIDENDIARLRMGDVVEKVFVVANLEKAEKLARETEQDIAVTERKLEYADARFRDAYLSFRIDVNDPSANFWGTDKDFIDWQEKQIEYQQRLEKLEARLRRTRALLRGDTVLVRKGMLVLATEEVVKQYRDVEDASEDIGEVLVVMRVGGRHMQWGEPARELAGYQPLD